MDAELVADLRVMAREMVIAAQAAVEASRAVVECLKGTELPPPPPQAPEPKLETRRLEVRVLDLRRNPDGSLWVDDDLTNFAPVGPDLQFVTQENQPFRVCPDPFKRVLTILGRACPTCHGMGEGLLAAAGGFSGGTCPRCEGTGDWVEVP